jgi:transcription antitermination factor NusG
MTTHWHVLYTRHRWETKVAAHLADKGLQYYCPMNRVEKLGRKKISPEALFPSWVFVKTDSAQLPALRQVKGVVNLVYWLGKPVTVPDAEMAALMGFVQAHPGILMERISVQVAATPEPVVHISTVSLDQYNLETMVVPSLGVSLSAIVKVPVMELVNQATAMPGMAPALRYAIS